MKSLAITVLAAAVALGACSRKSSTDNSVPALSERPLKEVVGDRFLIGAAINTSQANGSDSVGAAIVAHHFNSVVAENCMKHEVIHPAPGVYNWVSADSFVDYAERNNMKIIGHCLVWHSQLAPWFIYDENGDTVSADVLKERMREHISTVVGRYKGRIHGWDVVNEAIVEDGSFRDHSPYYQILGEELFPLALQYAHEADPDAELYLNDYGMNVPGRRDRYVALIKDLKSKGYRIDGIGMQAHMGMDYPDFTEWEAAIDSFATTGAKVMITEWDMSALPTVNQGANVSDRVEFEKTLNPYADGLPDSVSAEWNARMAAVWDILNRHADDISRVTVWGVNDRDSWRNNWPVRGRTDYPLIFSRDNELKPFLKEASKK